MHVGLYSPAWPPGKVPNGIVTYARIVRAELLRQGHRVSLFSGHCEPDDAERIYRVDVGNQWPIWRSVQRRLGRGWKSEYDFGPFIARTVLRVHRRERLDVFEMEESFGWCGDVARLVPIPLVVKLHGPAFLSMASSGNEASRRQLRAETEGTSLRSVRAIVAPSRSTMSETATRYSLSRGDVVTIPNPIDAVSDSLVWHPRQEWADEILFVGRFDYPKGGDAAVQAFARLARDRPRLRLNFVGPDHGLSRAEGGVLHLADYVRLNVEPQVASRIRVLGTLPALEVQRLRVRCGATLLASRSETFGYVVAEAMMQGCPIAAFDVVGVNELIVHGETGLLAPLGDIDGLAKHIERLLDHPEEAAAMGARARASITAQCGAEAIVGQMLDVYRRVAARAPAHG